jgi:hypothetical protein
LEDSDGWRVAFLVADIGHLSPILHRLTADRVRQTARIGADRLVMSVTHTHSGPGNYFGAERYNQQAGVFEGYDPYMVEFLVSRFVAALEEAVASLTRVRVGWGTAVVSGAMRNRSLEAFLLNRQPTRRRVTAATPAAQQFQAVDDTMTLLRVDRCDEVGQQCEPWGALSIFAVHATAYPPATDLLDGDVHAIVERQLEQWIEDHSSIPSSRPDSCPPVGSVELGNRGERSASGSSDGGEAPPCVFRSRAFHLFANGTEGDVSPSSCSFGAGTLDDSARLAQCERAHVSSRCELLRFRQGRRPSGPRTPPAPEEWRGSSLDACLDQARSLAEAVGTTIGTAAIELFEEIGDTGSWETTFRIQRAFETVELAGLVLPTPLCEPRSGTSTFGGAEDARTRIHGWTILWGIHSGIEEGGHGIEENPETCHGAKRVGLGALQGLLVGQYGFPAFAQLAVVRLGSVLLGAVPAEVTTEAGMLLKAELENNAPPGTNHVAIIGLANGYLQYITTAEEYEAQHYEGASNLYGPSTARVVAHRLGQLAAGFAADNPIVDLGPMTVEPGASASYFPRPTRGPPSWAVKREITSMQCDGGRFDAEWIDAHPGVLIPADGQVLEIQYRKENGWQPVAWDDGPRVVVRAKGAIGGGYLWGVTWRPETLPTGDYRLVLRPRPPGPAAHITPTAMLPAVFPASLGVGHASVTCR